MKDTLRSYLQINVRFNGQTARMLDALKRETGVPFVRLIRRAVREYYRSRQEKLNLPDMGDDDEC